MGIFSWIAQNSNTSIIIAYYARPAHPSRTYYLWDHQGNRWTENSYEGYGVFGGKDYFVLLAEMNQEYEDDVDDETKRCDGIDLYGCGGGGILYPNLTDCSEWTWRNERPADCHHQGGLLAFDDEEDEDEEDE